MKTMYRTYKEDYSEQELTEYELVKTDPRIKRPTCPLCHTDTYVTPMQYGLPDIFEIVEHDVGTEQEEFASATYSCEVEDYTWDCAHCLIRF